MQIIQIKEARPCAGNARYRRVTATNGQSYYIRPIKLELVGKRVAIERTIDKQYPDVLMYRVCRQFK